MIYAKEMQGDVVIALYTYDFEPYFYEDSGMVIITEDEYNELKAILEPDPVETDDISDSEALNIILGNEVVTDET